MQNIYINEEGKGFPVVLVHGFLGSSKLWNLQVSFLKNFFKVITLDLPGFGKSNKALAETSIEANAKIIFKCLKEKKIDKFHLVGHSMGGMITQTMAKIDGSKIEKLVCCSTGPLGNMPDRFETIDQSREKLKKNGLESMSKNIAKTWFVLGESSRHFDICIEAGKQTSIDAVDKALISMQEWNGTRYLKEIKNNTLILWGDNDRSYNYSQIQILEKKN